MPRKKKSIPKKRKTKESDFIFPTRSVLKKLVCKDLDNAYLELLYNGGGYFNVGGNIFLMISKHFNFPKKLRSKMWKKIYTEQFEYALRGDKYIKTMDDFKHRIFLTLAHLRIAMELAMK